MTDTEPEVPGWARQLSKRVDDLFEAMEQQRHARTATERREASGDVDEEARALRRLGLSRDEVDRLKKEQRRSEMREVLEELLAEREAATEDSEEEGETVVTLRDAASKRSEGRKVKPPKPPEEDETPEIADTDQPKNLVQRLGLG